jgi:hypothetical protein
MNIAVRKYGKCSSEALEMQTFSGGACPQTPLVEKIGLEFRVDIFTNFKGKSSESFSLLYTRFSGFPLKM